MDNMEKELWDAFYGKENKQERCAVLTEADLNRHNKNILNESIKSNDVYIVHFEEIDGIKKIPFVVEAPNEKNAIKKAVAKAAEEYRNAGVLLYPEEAANTEDLIYVDASSEGIEHPFYISKNYEVKKRDEVEDSSFYKPSIEYHSMLDGMHHLIVFNSLNDALNAYNELTSIGENEVDEFELEHIFSKAVDNIEINYRDVENGKKYNFIDEYLIVNKNPVQLYESYNIYNKNKLNEDFEVQPDLLDNEYDVTYKNGRRVYDFHTINNALEKLLPDWEYTGDAYNGDELNLIYEPKNSKASLNKEMLSDLRKAMAEKFGNDVIVRAGRSEYAPEQKKLFVGYLDSGDDYNIPEEELDEGCGKTKKKKKALKESVEPVYISVDVTRHNGSVIVKSDEFGKITYLPNDFEKLEDTIKRAVNDYAAENNIAEYEVIKLYESYGRKALKESDEKDSRFVANNLRRIRKIRDAINAGVDVSWGEMAFLQDNQETIKKYFPDDIELWQWANIPEDEWSAHEQSLKESDDLWSQIQNYKKKYGNPYEESRPTSNGVDDEIKKILNKYNQEYNFLYNNHDKVAGYEEAVRAWDEYINHPDFRELIGKVIKARHDMFTSDREIGALMFALDALGYLDKFDGKESSLEPVVKEFKMNEGKSAKFYKIKCPQFNHLTKINKLAGEGDELASYYMKHRNDEFYSSKEAKEELKRYKNTSFKTYLTVEEA